jgi:hypothetical protein
LNLLLSLHVQPSIPLPLIPSFPPTKSVPFDNMEHITIPTVSSRWVAAGLLFVVFITLKTTYRLLFSPLAGFPGPKFAASTKLFEAYHMIIKDDWLATLEKLHRQYGKHSLIRFLVSGFI